MGSFKGMTITILMSLVLVSTMWVGTADALIKDYYSLPFTGNNSNWKYQGYSGLSYMGTTVDATQKVRCTSQNAPSSNMRVKARVMVGNTAVLRDSGWKYNSGILSKNAWLSTNTAKYTVNKQDYGSTWRSQGFSSCWRAQNGSYYDHSVSSGYVYIGK